jgi:DUF1707 SHOCT-like domain
VGRRSTLRASDADREQVAERLRQATAEGRLLAEELEQRLGALFRARTYGELDELVADLPGHGTTPARRRERTVSRVRQVPAPALVLLVPIAVAIAIVGVVVVMSMFIFWSVVITIAWLAMGQRRGHYYPMHHYRRAMRDYRRATRHAYGRWRA